MDTVLLQQYSDELTLQYLAVFNTIDKHLDKVLLEDAFLPFNEKVKRVMDWEYSISCFVKMHHYQLKYFGELRNHITHGIKEHGHTYAYPSEHALAKLTKLKDAIVTPPLVGDIFAKDVYSCSSLDSLTQVVHAMHDQWYTHIPVYDQKNIFQWVLTEWDIAGFLASYMDHGSKSLDTVRIKDITFHIDNDAYLFVWEKENIYEIDKIFTHRRQEDKRLGAVFITKHGKSTEPLLGIITAGDVALVDSFVVH